MTDLASLLIKVDASQAKAGVKELDSLAAAGGRAEASTLRVSAAQVKAAGGFRAWEAGALRAGKATSGATAAASQMITQTMGVGKASGLARHHLQNLTFQVNDVAMALATGQNPMRVFIQQGSQIAQIGQQAGVGLGGMAKAVLLMLRPFAGIAALAGGVGLAFMGVKRGAEQADEGAKKLIATLGLTKDEIKDLKDTSVTWGDTMAATFDVLAERAGTSSSEVKGAWESALDSIGEFGKFSVAVLLGAFGALVKGVASAFVNLGKIVATAVSAAANFAVETFEGMLNKIIGGINTVAGFLGMGSLNQVSFGRVASPKFDLSNPLADARDQFLETFSDVQAGFGAIGAGARARRDRRVKDQAEEMIDDRPDKKGKKERAKKLSDEARAAEAATKAAAAYLESLRKETDGIGKNAIESQRMEVATAAAAARKAAALAPTQALRDGLVQLAKEIEAAGAAWEKVYKADQLAQFIKNTIEPLEQQASLIGLTAEQQARANLEFEKARIIAEFGAAAWERYAAAQGKIITDQFKIKNPLEEWAEQFKPDAMIRSMQEIQVRGLDGLSSAITDVITGTRSLKDAFGDLAKSIIADIIQMTIRMLIFRAISSMFPGLFGGGASTPPIVPSALGNVFAHGNVVPFARGGIVGGPTLFPMSGGRTGMMGEAGPEAVMPLARDSSGRLGVRAANSNAPIMLTVNVNAKDAVLTNAVKGWIVEGIGEAAPHIAAAAQRNTVRSMTRPRLAGGR